MQTINKYSQATKRLQNNEIGIVPTDTIYGISCLAKSVEKVEEIYKIKVRETHKPFVLLIGSVDDLEQFEIKLNTHQKNVIEQYWPGPVSIIFPVTNEKFLYLHRGVKSIAFRLPNKPKLINMLQNTGPIVSTSANLSKSEPINNVEEALEIFGDKVDFMLDEGTLDNPPSKILKMENEDLIWLRK